MPVSCAGIELDGLRPELFIHGLKQVPRLVRIDEAGGRVLHDHMRPQFLDLGHNILATGRTFTSHRHHGATKHHILFAHRDP